ncbi:MAG: PAS domain-containing protein [Alphaproteobacteria bacterium]|jgi:hypothetical protein|nr:PAS domain-containing protein [Alphaproteobacteria bacterium]MDP6872933.1 PAS domain-containing protein [Alphaproteobacteria bacterium]
MTDFQVIEEHLVPIDRIPDAGLTALVSYWERKKGGRPFALRRDIDPADIPGLLGNIRLVDIEAQNVFRFRLYGTHATNPDQRDMTGLTTGDYEDKAFGEVVTRHYAEVAADGVARCWHIKARVDAGEYEYLRVVLPISRNEKTVDALLVHSARLKNPFVLWR